MPIYFLYVPLLKGERREQAEATLSGWLDAGFEVISAAPEYDNGEQSGFNLVVYEPRYHLTKLAIEYLEQNDPLEVLHDLSSDGDGPESTIYTDVSF